MAVESATLASHHDLFCAHSTVSFAAQWCASDWPHKQKSISLTYSHHPCNKGLCAAPQGVFAPADLEEVKSLLGQDFEEDSFSRLSIHLGQAIPPAPPGFQHPDGASWACACLLCRCTFTDLNMSFQMYQPRCATAEGTRNAHHGPKRCICRRTDCNSHA